MTNPPRPPVRFTTWWPGVITYPPKPPPTRYQVLPQFSGGGTLAVAVTAFPAPFSGEGALSAQVSTVQPVTAAFSGAGTLSATAGLPSVAVAAAFTGAGTLSAAAGPTSGVAAAFTGDGTLSATAT